MSEGHDDLATLPRTLAEARLDQKRSDAPPLKCREHCHWCKRKRGYQGTFRLNLDWAEEDVAYGIVVGSRDERDHRPAGLLDRVDEAGLVGAPKCAVVDGDHGSRVVAPFWPNSDRFVLCQGIISSGLSGRP